MVVNLLKLYLFKKKTKPESNKYKKKKIDSHVKKIFAKGKTSSASCTYKKITVLAKKKKKFSIKSLKK
jgi:hypothetical protein